MYAKYLSVVYAIIKLIFPILTIDQIPNILILL